MAVMTTTKRNKPAVWKLSQLAKDIKQQHGSDDNE